MQRKKAEEKNPMNSNWISFETTFTTSSPFSRSYYYYFLCQHSCSVPSVYSLFSYFSKSSISYIDF